jgi:hypothetical protein
MGNPPYIRQVVLGDLKGYLQQHYQIFAGTADLYVYFVERGMQILREGGEFTYILPNKWMRAGYGDKLRQFVRQRRIMGISDFGDLPVFDEATTYPCVLELQRNPATDTFKAANIPTLEYPRGLRNYIRETAFDVNLSGLQDSGWTLTNQAVQQLLEKLRNSGKPLGEYVEGKIYRGVLTGLNEAFVIDAATRDRLIEEDPKSNEVIKPFLAGRDIKRYQTPKSDKFLIFTRRGINIEAYPAILKFLEQYKDRLTPKPKDWKGEWNGRKEGAYKWYEIQDSVDYWMEFEKDKIILPDIAIMMQALIDNEQYMCANTAYIIPRGDLFLLGLLNSNTVLFFYENLSASIRGGYLRFISQYLVQIPIPEALNGEKAQIETLVNQILATKQSDPAADTTALEREIDVLVYGLYGLSAEEVAIVEGEKK